ncbi:hypothetical protein DSECCO2_639280 [anaerobic digester metagenome]
MRTALFRKMSASRPENRAPAARPALKRKVNSPIQRPGSLHFESEENAAGKKAPQAAPSTNLEKIRIHRFSDKNIKTPETTVRAIPSPMNFRFPNLSERMPKGSIVARAPRKYPEKSRLDANSPYILW